MNALTTALREFAGLSGAGGAFAYAVHALQHAKSPRERRLYAGLAAITGFEIGGMVWWYVHRKHAREQLV